MKQHRHVLQTRTFTKGRVVDEVRQLGLLDALPRSSAGSQW